MREPKLYKDSYQLAVSIFHRTKSYPKPLRPTLGRSLEESALQLVFSTKRAMFNPGELKIRHLHKASDLLDEIRILVQLSRDLETLTVGGYGELCELTKEIGKEIGGLIKHERTKKSSAAGQ